MNEQNQIVPINKRPGRYLGKLKSITAPEQKVLRYLIMFYDIIVPVFRERAKKNNLKHYYVAIPYNCAIRLVETLFAIYKTLKYKKEFKFNKIEFLDVGCGKGNILALAKSLGYSVTGLEIRETYLHDLQRLNINYKIIDAFKFDEYQNFNIIYLFRPISHHYLMQRLFHLIVLKMKKGTILMDITDAIQLRFKCLRKLQSGVYIKIKEYDETEQRQNLDILSKFDKPSDYVE